MMESSQRSSPSAYGSIYRKHASLLASFRDELEKYIKNSSLYSNAHYQKLVQQLALGRNGVEVSVNEDGNVIINFLIKDHSERLYSQAFFVNNSDFTYRDVECKSLCTNFHLLAGGEYLYVQGNDSKLLMHSSNGPLYLHARNITIITADEVYIHAISLSRKSDVYVYNESMNSISNASDQIEELCDFERSIINPASLLKRTGLRSYLLFLDPIWAENISAWVESCPEALDKTKLENDTAIDLQRVNMPYITVVKGSSSSIHVFGTKDMHIYAIDGMRLIKSSDDGISWQALNSSEGSIKFYLYDSTLGVDRLMILFDHSIIMIDAETGDRVIIPPSDILVNKNVTFSTNFHSKDSIILNYDTKACAEDANSNKCESFSSVTTDGGQTWKHINVKNKSCFFVSTSRLLPSNKNAISCVSAQNKEIPPDKIHPNPNPREFDLILDYKNVTPHKHFKNLISHIYASDTLVVKISTPEGQMCLISVPDGSFIEALDENNNTIEDVTILKLKSGYKPIFAFAKSDENLPLVSDLYTDTALGSNLKLLVKNVETDKYGNLAVMDIDNIPGTLIMNTYVLPENPTAEVEKNHTLSTHITYDYQNFYKITDYSLKDKNAEMIAKSKGHTLHINFLSSTYQERELIAYIETKNGMFIANGNVGNTLDLMNLSTFITIDGGRNWSQVSTYSNHIAIADKGNFILCYENRKVSRNLLYSNDGGIKFSDKLIEELPKSEVISSFNANNISSIRDGESPNIIMYGTIRKDYSNHMYMLSISFSRVFDRICIPPPSLKDFSTYDLELKKTDSCIMGSRYSVYRKKDRALCSLGGINNLIQKRESCLCKEEDFECKPGARLEDGICKSIIPKYDKCIDGITHHTGYELSRYTSCTNGMTSYEKLGAPCVIPSSHMPKKFIFLIYLSLIIIISFIFRSSAELRYLKIKRYSRKYGIHSPVSVFLFAKRQAFKFKQVLQSLAYRMLWFLSSINNKIRAIFPILDKNRYRYLNVAHEPDYMEESEKTSLADDISLNSDLDKDWNY